MHPCSVPAPVAAPARAHASAPAPASADAPADALAPALPLGPCFCPPLPLSQRPCMCPTPPSPLPRPVTFSTLAVVGTSQTALSWERLCAEHCRRRDGRDTKGQKQHLWVAGQLSHSHTEKKIFSRYGRGLNRFCKRISACGQSRNAWDVMPAAQIRHVAVMGLKTVPGEGQILWRNIAKGKN